MQILVTKFSNLGRRKADGSNSGGVGAGREGNLESDQGDVVDVDEELNRVVQGVLYMVAGGRKRAKLLVLD
jgi:hypothetical protein